MSLRILSVFDSAQAVNWISAVLADHHLTQVGTIMSAMHVLQREKIDVTLVQLHLQNESLFDLLRSIRRNDYYRDMSFICCDTSEHGDKSQPHIEAEFLARSCLLYGATKVLTTDEFYAKNFEQAIIETLTSPGSRSGT
jgi:hypothetical protein